MKSVQELLIQGDRLLSELISVDGELASAMGDDSNARRQLKEAEQALSLADAEIVSTAVIQAKGKSGPLAGLAITSDAYKMKVSLLLDQAHIGPLQPLARRAQQWQSDADAARLRLDQSTVRFSAVRHASTLLASMLQATSSLNGGNKK